MSLFATYEMIRSKERLSREKLIVQHGIHFCFATCCNPDTARYISLAVMMQREGVRCLQTIENVICLSYFADMLRYGKHHFRKKLEITFSVNESRLSNSQEMQNKTTKKLRKYLWIKKTQKIVTKSRKKSQMQVR